MNRGTRALFICMNFIVLHSTKLHGPFIAHVDPADYDHLNQWKWYVVGNYRKGLTYYARRFAKGVSGLMHREITQAPDGYQVDHADGCGLNNTRSNLRICTHAQNMHNRRTNLGKKMRLKGVRFQHGGWHARIKIDGRVVDLGRYETSEAAALAYDAAARGLFGEFAKPNFPNAEPSEELLKDMRAIQEARAGGRLKLRQNARIGASGYIGVVYHEPDRMWRARIRFKGKNHSVGYFQRPEDAARAYDAKARELRGEFARLNFPREQAA